MQEAQCDLITFSMNINHSYESIGAKKGKAHFYFLP